VGYVPLRRLFVVVVPLLFAQEMTTMKSEKKYFVNDIILNNKGKARTYIKK